MEIVRSGMKLLLNETLNNGETGTRALLVVHKGKIIGEAYASGFDKNSKLLGWSMCKSITATLVGTLVQKGLIDINEVVPIEMWQVDERKMITWKHLLQMNSGLDWNEVYHWISDVTRMLYTEPDVYDCSIQSKLDADPGTYWEYSSGTTNILSGLIRKVINDDAKYNRLPFEYLFNPIDAGSFVMEMDAAGNFIGSSYAYATARDWAKFGLLYLNEGKWNGQQIIPQWWPEFVRTPASGSDGSYGAHFWLNRNNTFKDVPPDLYFADGFHGQRVFIIPSMELVVVRLGLSKDEKGRL